MTMVGAFLACWAGILTYSAIVIGRSFARIGSYMVTAPLEVFLQGLVSMYYLMIALETLRAAILWATQGPVAAIAWVTARIAAWEGF